MSKPLRLDALIRVSRRGGREGESFRSPAQQREVIERWAATNDAEIVAWYESIDVSGKTMNRSDVAAALGRIRAGQTDGVIIAWLNRFSRAPVAEALTVYDEVKTARGRVVAVDMAGIDPNDPTGEMALTTMLAVNRMQWRQVADRWDMNRRDAIKAGIPIGRPPFGYRRGDDKRFVIYEPEAELVREVFQRRASGSTWLEIARWMDSVAPKSDGTHWGRNTVRDMIGRRTYLGEVHHGEHSNPKAHEAIIDPALWRRAQGEPGRRTPRGSYLLTGLVRCSGCGRRMRASSGGAGSKPPIYNCATEGCPSRYSVVTVKRIDAEVVEQFFNRLDAFHLQAVDGGEVEEARSEVERLTGELERLAQIVPKHPAAVQAHQGALDEAEGALIEAEDKLHALASSTERSGLDARELRTDWPTLTLEEKREILRAGVDAVLVRRASRMGPNAPTADRLLVLFRGEAPAGLDSSLSGAVQGWTWDDDVRSLSPAP